MHVLLVCCHPEPSSFTHAQLAEAVAAIAAAGHSHEVSNLHAEGFDPVAGRHDFLGAADRGRFHYQTEQAHAAATGTFSADIEREQTRFEAADMVIFLFPLWWGAPPAMLKGWFDRVLAYGFAYVDGVRFESGLFKDRTALIAVSTGGTAARFSEGGSYGPIDQVLYPMIHCQLRYLGMDVPPPFVAYAAPRVGDEGRARLLAEWRERVTGELARIARRLPVAGRARTIPQAGSDGASGG